MKDLEQKERLKNIRIADFISKDLNLVDLLQTVEEEEKTPRRRKAEDPPRETPLTAEEVDAHPIESWETIDE